MSELTRKTRIDTAVKKVDVGKKTVETGFVTGTFNLCGINEATKRCPAGTESVGIAKNTAFIGIPYPGVGNNAIVGGDYSPTIIVRA